MKNNFIKRLKTIRHNHQTLIHRQNKPVYQASGLFERYTYPVLTAEHVPLEWRYDFDFQSNPYCLERLGINAVFNAGAIEWQGKICLAVRIEGKDRKSFFGIAESDNGVDFTFHNKPVILPRLDEAETTVYDMRLTRHEDGWIYGLFCTERKDPRAAPGNESAAIAQCGIVRTKNLIDWERLPDLVTPSAQQRNVVLHPELIDGQYAFYTRPQDGFINTGKGIGFGLSQSIEQPVIREEKVIAARVYHTVYELKNGQGPPPIKTKKGWLHLAHGVRNTAAGLRYVLYLFLSDLNDPSHVIKRPSGYFIAPEGEEQVGDVSNVVFSNGWVARPDGDVLIYYASSDTRIHLAATKLDILLDYVENTPPDPLTSHECVRQRLALIDKNNQISTEI